jgi:hypothetical protein
MLDKLLDGGHISSEEYIKRLPAGVVTDRQALIESLRKNRQEGDI